MDLFFILLKIILMALASWALREDNCPTSIDDQAQLAGVYKIYNVDGHIKEFDEDFNEDGDYEEYAEYNASVIETIVFIYPKLLAALANRSVAFLKTMFVLFKKIFVDNDVASLENISVLSDMFNTGHEMQQIFLDMIYIITGEPKDEDLLF